MRLKMIAGNWKMNQSPTETATLLQELLPQIISNDVEVLICPPFISIPKALELAEGRIFIGAQNMSEHDSGAFTGEISANMLVDLGIHHVLIGHSERRELFNETDTIINAKMKQATTHGLSPILCVGENLEDRELGITTDVIRMQIARGLKDIPLKDSSNIIFAYEPIWAIGTGKTASSAEAEAVCKEIRLFLATLYSKDMADKARILYGGSVNKENATELFSMENIDGGLVGGASLNKSLIEVIHYNKQ